jgi:hypothetical protein
MYQMTVIYSTWQENTSTFSIPRPSKIYPNWDFWFKNKASGNPRRLWPNSVRARESFAELCIC